MGAGGDVWTLRWSPSRCFRENGQQRREAALERPICLLCEGGLAPWDGQPRVGARAGRAEGAPRRRERRLRK